jgi:HD-GYP domain-containing protein (c-di-GMP phosphodiesterase class II)
MDISHSKTAFHPESECSDRMEPKRKAYLVPQTDGADPVSLDAPQVIIGRSSGVDCRIADLQASRRHARILAVHNRYYVQDLDSTNGTFVNGDKVGHERLAHGDLVAFGSTVFRFEIGAEPDPDYLRKLNLDMLSALAKAVDKKDAYTLGHSDAVARVAEQLALKMGYSAAAAERVGIAGRLHDIGKIGVPDAVLRKVGRLDDAEFALIRKHPCDGEAILAPLDFLADVLPAVRQHHERFDGRGYPDGLAGQAIAAEARIVQLADAYHAMASDRPYRKPLAQDFIHREFAKSAGTQFDPEVTRAFLNLLPSLPSLLATVR